MRLILLKAHGGSTTQVKPTNRSDSQELVGFWLSFIMYVIHHHCYTYMLLIYLPEWNQICTQIASYGSHCYQSFLWLIYQLQPVSAIVRDHSPSKPTGQSLRLPQWLPGSTAYGAPWGAPSSRPDTVASVENVLSTHRCSQAIPVVLSMA